MELSTILAFAFGLFILYIIGVLLVIPIKIIFKLIINGIIGGVLLLLFNFVGGMFGLALAINPLNAIIAGILGIPGVILLLIIQKLL